jgi:carboxypeptidase Taq
VNTVILMTCDGYLQLCQRSREVYLLRSISAVLSWDFETYLPHKAVPYRSDQLSYLEAKAHSLFVEAKVGDWIKEAEDAGYPEGSEESGNVRSWRHAYDRATKIPVSIVEEFEKARTIARDAWVSARADSDFSKFEGYLEKIVDLSRTKASLWGFEESPYDALMDDYEPGIKASQLKPVFEELRLALVDLTGKLAGGSVSEEYLDGHYPPPAQLALSTEIAEAFGYDFASGRIDSTAHPFCTTVGPFDQRITTRYNENRFEVCLYGVLHETGHALYEQGLRKEAAGLPSGDAVSSGIHESQSRLWENHVGRSLPFWSLWHATAVKHLPDLARYSPEQLCRGLQRVAPTFIRVEADEVTYDLHILLRFEIELALIEGKLRVKDLPEVWNAHFKEMFGLDVPEDRLGVLQDIHWSLGAFGYFPTYTLGNLNAAQLMVAAEKQVPALNDALGRGDYAPLLNWLRTNIHQHGRRYLPAELMEKATGEPTRANHRIEYLRRKYLG